MPAITVNTRVPASNLTKRLERWLVTPSGTIATISLVSLVVFASGM